MGNICKCKHVFGLFATHSFTKSTKVDILEASPYVDVTTTSGFSGQTENEAELTFLSDLTENSKTSAIKCLFTVDRLLKLSISANCNFCGNIIKNEVCSFVGCHAGVSHHPPKITINSSIQGNIYYIYTHYT